MTIDELTSKVANGETVKWKDAKVLLNDNIEQVEYTCENGTSVPVNFTNCNLTINGLFNSASNSVWIADDAVLYNPII